METPDRPSSVLACIVLFVAIMAALWGFAHLKRDDPILLRGPTVQEMVTDAINSY